jgi:hypothetical protein
LAAYGDVAMRRGHWSDRLAGIDADLSAMEDKLKAAPDAKKSAGSVARAIAAATGRPNRPSVPCTHTPPQSFDPGRPLPLVLRVAAGGAEAPTAARLYYRHVDQAERWVSAEMAAAGAVYTAAIPGEYTQSPFPLEYYFELMRGSEAAWLFPAFNRTLSNQPYYAVSMRGG